MDINVSYINWTYNAVLDVYLATGYYLDPSLVPDPTLIVVTREGKVSQHDIAYDINKLHPDSYPIVAKDGKTYLLGRHNESDYFSNELFELDIETGQIINTIKFRVDVSKHGIEFIRFGNVVHDNQEDAFIGYVFGMDSSGNYGSFIYKLNPDNTINVIQLKKQIAESELLIDEVGNLFVITSDGFWKEILEVNRLTGELESVYKYYTDDRRFGNFIYSEKDQCLAGIDDEGYMIRIKKGGDEPDYSSLNPLRVFGYHDLMAK